MRFFLRLVCLSLAPAIASADSARLDEGFEEACLTIDQAPNFIPVRMNESHYWDFRQAPSISDFIIIRDDTQIFLTVLRESVSCAVIDRVAAPDAAQVEAALERRFPGAWSRSGETWTVNGAKPLIVRLIDTVGGAGIAVETGN